MRNRFSSRETLNLESGGINPSVGGFSVNNVNLTKGITQAPGAAGVASIQNIEASSLGTLTKSGLVLTALTYTP
jgi:hypothetical protein